VRTPAQAVDRWTWRSSDGPVEHVKTLCDRGHLYTVAVDWLARQLTPEPMHAAPVPVP
jgi:hypothetical protein